MTSVASSARDPRVLRAARLLRDSAFRRSAGAFVVDSVELLAAVRSARLGVQCVFVADGTGRGSEGLDRVALDRSVPVVRSSADAMRSLAAVGDTPVLIAVVDVPAAPRRLEERSLVLSGIRDGGNVGSIIRTACAFELPRVLLTTECEDPFGRKALRAAQGATFREGLVATECSLDELATQPGRPPLAAAVPRGGVAPEALPPGAAVVLGSERDGLAPGEVALCDLTVSVPAPGFESLNVAAAAAILSHVLATPSPGAGAAGSSGSGSAGAAS